MSRGFFLKTVLNSVCPSQRILENSDFWSEEGEKHKEQGDQAQNCHGNFRRSAGELLCGEEPRFIEIGDGGGDEEDGDVDPIGRFSDDAVVGVEKYGDQRKPQQNSAKLDAPKIRSVLKIKALQDGK